MLKKITLNGETKSIAEWARSVGLKPGTLQYRINVNNGILTEELLVPIISKASFVCVVCNKTAYAPPSANRQTCSKKCLSVILSKALSKHKESNTRLYNIWCHIKSRAIGKTKSKLIQKYYKNKNIEMYDVWVNNYLSFKEWAMSNGYTDELQIDRIDGSKGYFPENCRWATRNQQMSNTRKNRKGLTSKHKGVSWCSNVKKWRAQIQHNNTHYHIGLYKTEIDAYKAYLVKAKEIFGEYMDEQSKKDFNNLIKE